MMTWKLEFTFMDPDINMMRTTSITMIWMMLRYMFDFIVGLLSLHPPIIPRTPFRNITMPAAAITQPAAFSPYGPRIKSSAT